MSSGLDVYLEKWSGEPLPEFPNPKPYYEIKELNNKSGETMNHITFYARVNANGMTHGAMKQIDDNIKVVYDVVEHRIVELSII